MARDFDRAECESASNAESLRTEGFLESGIIESLLRDVIVRKIKFVAISSSDSNVCNI